MSNPWEDFNSPVAEQDSAAPWEEFGGAASPWEEFQQAQEPPRPKPREILAKTLQDNNYFNSATSAMSGAWLEDGAPQITRNEDGTWNLPVLGKNDGGFVDATKNMFIGLGQKIGFQDSDKDAQEMLWRMQQDNNLSDDEIKSAWDDLAKTYRRFDEGEKARVLSDGEVVLNYKDTDWLDDEKAKSIIDALPISDDAKKRQLDTLWTKQLQISTNKLMAYEEAAFANPLESPMEYADRTGKTKEYGSKEFLLEYEREVASKAGWGSGLISDFHSGHQKLLSTATGFAGMVTGNEDVAKFAASVAGWSQLRNEGSFDTGITGSIIEELPSLALMAAVTRGVGSGVARGVGSKAAAGAIATGATAEAAAIASQTAIAASSKGLGAVSVASVSSMLAMSGVQSAGQTFASAINDGKTVSEAREDAIKSGVNTMIVTGLFQMAGAGGLEKTILGKAGEKAGSVTIRDLFAAQSKAETAKAFAKLAGGAGLAMVSEGAEEGLDEAMQAFLTADPDTNLADAWINAWDAAKVGAAIGGVFHAGAGALDALTNPDAERLIPQQMEELRRGAQSMYQQATKPVSALGLINGARARVESLSQKQELQGLDDKESEELSFLQGKQKEDGSFEATDLEGWNGYTIDDSPLPSPNPQRVITPAPVATETTQKPGEARVPIFTPSKAGKPPTINSEASGAEIAETIFGPLPDGLAYDDSQIDPAKFAIRPDGVVTYAGVAYNRKVMADGSIVEDNTRPRGDFRARSIPSEWVGEIVGVLDENGNVVSEDKAPAKETTTTIATNEPDIQGSTKGESQAQAQVPMREVSTGEASQPSKTPERSEASAPQAEAAVMPTPAIKVTPEPSPQAASTAPVSISAPVASTQLAPSKSDGTVDFDALGAEVGIPRDSFLEPVLVTKQIGDSWKIAVQDDMDQVDGDVLVSDFSFESKEEADAWIATDPFSKGLESTQWKRPSRETPTPQTSEITQDAQRQDDAGNQTQVSSKAPAEGEVQGQEREEVLTATNLRIEEIQQKIEKERANLVGVVEGTMAHAAKMARIANLEKELGILMPVATPASISAPQTSPAVVEKAETETYSIEPLDETGMVQDEIQMTDGSVRTVDRKVSIRERSQIKDSSGAVVWTGPNREAQSALDRLNRSSAVSSTLQMPETSARPTAATPEARVKESYNIANLATGTVVGDQTPLGPLQVGQPVIIEHEETGEPMGVRIVTSKTIGEDGTPTYKLTENLTRGDARRVLESGEEAMAIVEADVDHALSLAEAALTARGAQDEAKVKQRINAMLQAALTRIAGKKYAEEHLEFSSNDADPMAQLRPGNAPGKNKIVVNASKWVARLEQNLKGVPYDSDLARMIARDFVAEMQTAMWHEANHDAVHEAYRAEPELVLNAMRDLLANAQNNQPAREFLADRARARFAATRPSMENATDEEVVAFLQGQEVKGQILSEKALDEEVFAVGAEFLADFVQNLRSGVDPMAIRATSDRFVKNLLGDPTKVEAAMGRSLIQRIVELIKRGLEATQRFMNAHRLMGTLPESFRQLASDVDQLMQANGIQAPDFNNVLSSKLQDLSSRMAEVDSVERILSKKVWDDGTREWELKSFVRGIIRNFQAAQPEIDPVVLNPATGMLEAREDLSDFIPQEQVDALNIALEKLNDPRRSLTAIDAAAAARDVRMILRNLNMDIPVAPDKQTGIRKGLLSDFGRTLEILNENLLSELESRVGIPADELIRRINSNLESPAFSASTSGTNAVHLAMTGYAPYDQAQAEMDQINEELSDIAQRMDRARKDGDDATMQSLEPRREDLIQRSQVVSTKARAAIEAVRSYVPPARPTGSQVKESLDMESRRSSLLQAEVAQRRALARMDAGREIGTIRDVFDLASRSLRPEVLAEVAPGVDAQVLSASLNKIRDVRDAFARVSVAPDHINYLLVGGRKPPLMRVDRDQEWRALGELKNGVSTSLALLPMSATRIVRGKSPIPQTGDLEGVNVPIIVEDPDAGTITFSTAGDFPLDDRGRPDAIESAAIAISDASHAADRALGVTSLDRGTFTKEEVKTNLYRNARALGRMLARDMHGAMIRGEGAITTVEMDQAGFPSRAFVDANGTTRGVLEPNAIALPDIPEGLFDKFDKDDPDYKEKTEAKNQEAYSKGFVARTLLEVARFLDRMEATGPDVFTESILWHGGGMTPAGAAYSIVAPKFLEFVALTKPSTVGVSAARMDYIAAMKESLNPEEAAELDRIYSGLMTRLENADRFAGKYQSKEVVDRAFWDLREMAIAANQLYRSSLEEAHDIAEGDTDPNDESYADDRMSPLDESLIRSNNFHKGLDASLAQRLLGGRGVFGGTAISLRTPVAAAESLEVLDSLEEEYGRVVRVSNAIKNGQVTDWDQARLMFETDDRQTDVDRTPMSDSMANTTKEWLLDQMAEHEQRVAARESRVITQLLLSIYGGDETTVRRVVNSFSRVEKTGGLKRKATKTIERPATFFVDDYGNEQFAGAYGVDPQEIDVTETEGGRDEVHWDRAAIRRHIRNELERMHQAEVARGAIISDVIYERDARKGGRIRNVVYDQVFTGTDERQGLIQKHSEFRAMLEQILNTGGHIHAMTDSTAFDQVRLEDLPPDRIQNDSSGTSVLHGLLGRIGNVSILTGRVNKSQMYGDEETRVPSLAFIPDPTNPILVLPYGKLDPTKEELSAAIESVVTWLGEHGGVDIVEVAKPLIKQLGDALGYRSKAAIRGTVAKASQDALMDYGVTIVPDDVLREIDAGSDLAPALIAQYGLAVRNPKFIPQSKFESMVKMWSNEAYTRLEKAWAESGISRSDILDQRLLRSRASKKRGGISEKRLAARVLTQSLIDSSVKEVLVLTSSGPVADLSSDLEYATYGELVGYHNVRGMAELAARDNNLYLSDSGQDIEDQLGRGLVSAEKAAQIEPESNAFLERLNQIFPDKPKEDVSLLQSPMAPRQVEWANAMLYSVLRRLTPTSDKTQPIIGTTRTGSGLSEYEARQLLAVFGQKALSEALESKVGYTDGAWGSPQFLKVRGDEEGGSRPVTVDDLVNATGEAAKRLQEIFYSGWSTKGVYPGSGLSEGDSVAQERRYDTYSVLDPLREGATRNKWHENRKAKGAIWAAEKMGVEFETVETGGVKSKHAMIAPNLAAMRAAMKREFLLKFKETIYDENGNLLPDGQRAEVDVFEWAKRSILAEDIKTQSLIKDAQKEADAVIKRQENFKAALDALESFIESSNTQSVDDFVRGLGATGNTVPVRYITRAIRRAMQDRESASNSLASDLLSNFERGASFVDAFYDPISPRQSSAISEASPAMERLRGIARNARPWTRKGRAIAKMVADGVDPMDMWKERSAYNSVVADIFRDEVVKTLMAGQGGGGAWMIQIGDTPELIMSKAGRLTGLLNKLSDVSAVRRMATQIVLDASLDQQFRVGSDEGLGMADRTAANARLTLSDDAQVKVLEILSRHRDYFSGPRVATTREEANDESSVAKRAEIVEEIGRVIYDDTYARDKELAASVRDSAKALHGQMLTKAMAGDIRKAEDVHRIIGAARTLRDYGDQEVDPFLRNQAVAELLQRSLSEYARGDARAIRGHLLQIASMKEEKLRFAGFRLDGWASLTLTTEVKEEGRKVSTASPMDVEIARRVLDEYGNMWAQIYMDHYGRGDFEVGLSVSERAQADADLYANQGAGMMVRHKGQTYRRITDGILEPLDARERVLAILRAQGSKLRPEIAMARLRRIGTPQMTIVPLENGLYAPPLGGFKPELLPSDNVLGMEKDDFAELIRQIQRGEVKPVISGVDRGAYEESLKEARSKAVKEIRERILSTKERIENIQRYKHMRNLRDAAKRELAVLEEELKIAESGVANMPALFMPETTGSRDAGERVADEILAAFNPRTMKSAQDIYIQRSRLGGLGKDPSMDMDKVTRNILRNQIVQSYEILEIGILINGRVEPGAGPDLHDELYAAIQQLRKKPNDAASHAQFHRAQNRAISYKTSVEVVNAITAGYIHTKNPVEAGWFMRAFIHESAKVKGVFGKSLEAQKKVNLIRAVLYNGADGNGGKNAARKINEHNAEILAKAANKIPKERRLLKTSQGLLLAQLRSYMTVYGDKVGQAKDVRRILQAAEVGYARANAQSKAETLPAASLPQAILQFIPRKYRQLWNRMTERGFYNLDNQLIFADMMDEVMPMLDQAIESGGGDGALNYVVKTLSSRWGAEATEYEKTLTGVFAEAALGISNVMSMRGVPEDLLRRPVVPFIWSNMSKESYTSSDIKSTGDLLDPMKSSWMSSPFRDWKRADKFDLLDFDGISSPLRVLEDMTYRTMVAPAYDAVAAIVGDVSTASEHFTQFSVDPETKALKIGAMAAIQKLQNEEGLVDYDEMKRTESSSLAIGNMIKDEIMNDMLGFSASNRAIELYRKIAIIGLGRKLISLVQPVTQTLSPIIGYVVANSVKMTGRRPSFNGRGLSFLPVLLKYNLGKMGEFGDHRLKGLTASVDRIVKEYAPVIAFRASDGIDMAREAAQDARLRGADAAPSPFLGRAAPVVMPAAQAGRVVVDGYFKFTTKALELLIGRPEGAVIRPLMAHEMLSELNSGRRARGQSPVSLEEMLSDPHKAGVTPAVVQNAIVRVEELFGTSAREEKGKLSQPSKSLMGEVAKSAMTTLAGHPMAMASNSWGAWRMLIHNPYGSPEFNEGLRILTMTVTQNMAFVLMTGPVVTYAVSAALAALAGWDEEKRREWEGWWYGIDPDDKPGDRQKKIRYWVSTLINRNEDPYGYSWHKGEWSEEQEEKHDGYRMARFAQELVNQLPVVGSLSSTTLGGSLVDMGLKASGISPSSAVKQAGIVLPEKWGFSGTANDPDNEDTPKGERMLYQATSFWANYLSDANSMAFAMDAMFQGLKYASNNPDDLDAWDAFLIAMHMAPGVREKDRAIQRYVGSTKPDFIALKEWKD